MGKPLQIFFFLDCHQMIRKKRVQWSITLSMQQSNYDIHETNLIMFLITTLILRTVHNCWILLSLRWTLLPLSGIFRILKSHLWVLNTGRRACASVYNSFGRSLQNWKTVSGTDLDALRWAGWGNPRSNILKSSSNHVCTNKAYVWVSMIAQTLLGPYCAYVRGPNWVA